MTVAELLSAFADWGLPFLAALLVGVAGYKRMWVWGYQLEAAEKRADRFETLALDLLHLANKATDAAATRSPRDA